ncbi:hypothetical protein Golomagni_01424 [Golovinomyces magnicellulatus]|nr:hypothetical protein Golomagni_01424 [Golovinomyces magnicellulatus]
MGFVQRVLKQLPTAPEIQNLDDVKKKTKTISRLSFFQRPLRIKGDSTISIPLGVVLLFPCIFVLVILVLIVRHPKSGLGILTPAGAPPAIRKISEAHDKVFVTGCLEPDTSQPRANAAFVVLARNKELDGVIQSIKSIERHFNRWYNYPYVFLNDAEFNSTFKETVANYTSSSVEFGTIDPKMWGFPDWIDPKVAKEGIAKQGDAAIMYGGMESYHAMCRFYSGYV